MHVLMDNGPKKRHHAVTKSVRLAERRRLVAANLLAGATYAEIANALGVSKNTVHNDYKAILKEWREQYSEDLDAWVKLQLRRIDVMINAVWDKARAGDYNAIDRVLKMMNQQARLLGVENGMQIDVNVQAAVQNNITIDDLRYARDVLAEFESVVVNAYDDTPTLSPGR